MSHMPPGSGPIAFELTRGIVSVKDYGAKGDGITDDAAFINAAIAAAAATSGLAYGATVYFPKGTYLIGATISIANGVRLVGAGPASTYLKAKNTFNATSLIKNTSQDGTQEFAFIESMMIDGNKGGGAVCSTAVVDFVSLFINSYIRDVVILNGSNVGLRVAAANASGPVLIENVWVAHSNGDNVVIEETGSNTQAMNGIVCINLTSEHQATGKAALKLKGSGHCAGWCFYNTHIEMANGGASTTGITIDGVSRVLFDGVQLLCGSIGGVTGISITNVVQNVEIQIRGVTNNNLITPVLSDLKNNAQMNAVNIPVYWTADTFVTGGLRVKPDATAVLKPFAAMDSSGTDRMWITPEAYLSGNSGQGAALVFVADATNQRPFIFFKSDLTRAYGFQYNGNNARFRYVTGGVDAWEVNSSGLLTILAGLTVVGNVTVNSGSTVTVGSATSFVNNNNTSFDGPILQTREVVPSQITADQNNYSPTNMSSAVVLLINSDAARNITGIATGVSGRWLWVYNNGAFNITLKHQSGSSSAGNQIIGRGGADVVLTPNTGVEMYYSPSLTKWIVMTDTL